LRHGRHIEKLSAAEQHQVRIELKKLHYAADFLLPLIHCGKDGRRFLRRIAQLQDLLGSLNDNVNIRKMLVQIVNGKYPHS
ncbi:CHAD domain-containing protein, partial [Clostridium perfringens]